MWGLAGPAIGADGTMYAETGDGQFDPAAEKYPNSIVALTSKDLKLKDYYTPTNADWLFKRDLDMNVTPVIFPYKGRELLVGSGKEGRFFMLDTRSLGGADHRTPLFRSELISNEACSRWLGSSASRNSIAARRIGSVETPVVWSG